MRCVNLFMLYNEIYGPYNNKYEYIVSLKFDQLRVVNFNLTSSSIKLYPLNITSFQEYFDYQFSL